MAWPKLVTFASLAAADLLLILRDIALDATLMWDLLVAFATLTVPDTVLVDRLTRGAGGGGRGEPIG
jgi:hypothetical protein